MKYTLIFVSALLISACTANVTVEPNDPTPTPTPLDQEGLPLNSPSPTPNSDEASIRVMDQAVTNTVTIEEATIPTAGFIDIHESVNGEVGNIIGTSSLVRANVRGVRITLNKSVKVGDELIAMIHKDTNNNGIHEFPGPDVPEQDTAGNPVLEKFEVIE